VPVRLDVKRSGEAMEIGVAKAAHGWRIAVCDAQGQSLAVRPASGNPIRLSPSDLPTPPATPACVKLLDGARLVDAVALPGKN
jgi:hypothetical protein